MIYYISERNIYDIIKLYMAYVIKRFIWYLSERRYTSECSLCDINKMGVVKCRNNRYVILLK